MKRVLLLALLFLSLLVCFTSPAWAGGLDDAQAGAKANGAGKYEEAIRLFTKAIASGELSRENLVIAYYNRGIAWFLRGDDDKAIADYTKAVELGPKFADAYHNRGLVWIIKGDNDKAIADFTKVVEIDPQYAAAYYNRGLAWHDNNDYDKAIADYSKAIDINPRYVDAYYHRGQDWNKKGDYDKAIVDYTKVIDIQPRHIDAYNSLAWLMATCPVDRFRDGKQAIAFAEKAVKLRETADRLDTLAAAYAEAGRFEEAIKTQEMAITKLKQSSGWTEHSPEYEKQLSSYKAGKPWREK